MLDGIWNASHAVLSGQAFPEPVVKSLQLQLEAGRYHLQNDHGTYTTDSAGEVQTMTITGTEGPNAGKTILAIYRFLGTDLQICYELGSGPRPSGFSSEAGTQHFLVLYHRHTP